MAYVLLLRRFMRALISSDDYQKSSCHGVGFRHRPKSSTKHWLLETDKRIVKLIDSVVGFQEPVSTPSKCSYPLEPCDNSFK